MTEFFQPDKAYQHDSPHGSEGIFLVQYVGRAPVPFEHHSETLGVAFGWRWGLGPNGWEGQGSYLTPDFAGWTEIPPPPCGARAGSRVCVVTGPPRSHGQHIAENGDYWVDVEPCKHQDCQHIDCDPEPTVYCGTRNESGAQCFYIADHTPRPHAF